MDEFNKIIRKKTQSKQKRVCVGINVIMSYVPEMKGYPNRIFSGFFKLDDYSQFGDSDMDNFLDPLGQFGSSIN